MCRRRWGVDCILGAAFISTALLSCVASPDEEQPRAGAYAVRQEVASWYDLRRLREIPVRIYRPEAAGGPYPLVVFSPGLGTSRDHYSYLGRYWASHGYVAVFLTHPGADEEVIYGDNRLPVDVLQAAVAFIQQVAARSEHPQDVSFVLDELGRSLVYRDVVDMQRVAAAGHSFGAFTVLTLIGMRVETLDGVRDFRDTRIQVAIAMSPPGPGALGLGDEAWNNLQAPCLSMTGTLDWDPATTNPLERRATFERSAASDQYLATIGGGTHGMFDDRSPWTPDRAAYSRHHATIAELTTAFLDAYLRRDQKAQDWLLNGGPDEVSDGACTLEYRRVTPVAGTP